MNQKAKFDLLMAKKKSGLVTANTRLTVSENGYTVRYHNTDVVTVKDGQVLLDNGGYHTDTTKKKISLYQSFVKVYQKKFVWYVAYNGENIPWNTRYCLVSDDEVIMSDDKPGFCTVVVDAGIIDKVKDVPDDYVLVTGSDVKAMHEYSISDDYSLYFVKTEKGRIVGLYGAYSAVPWLDAQVEDALARYYVSCGMGDGYLPNQVRLFADLESALEYAEDFNTETLELGLDPELSQASVHEL